MSDDSILIILLFFVAVIAGYYGYILFMLKTRMDELEANLGISNFFCNMKPNAVVCGGKYKGVEISIENEASFSYWKDEAHTLYTLNYNPKVIAEILPGPGLRYEEEKENARKASEEASKKVWSARLTAEERKIIEERKKTNIDHEEEDSSSHEALKVISSKLIEVNNYLDENGRREALIELFKNGAKRVNMGFGEVTMECMRGNYNDHKTMKYAENLKNLFKVCIVDEIL